MLDVFVVLHIPGVHRLLPTTSTVQGVNSSFIPTENGDERLDCACADVTITGLNLSLQWLDAGEQGCSGAGIIPVSSCLFGLSKFQEVQPASSYFQLPKSISHYVIRTVADVLNKGLFGLAFPNQVACISKPTRLLSVLHTWNAARELERNRLSHDRSFAMKASDM